MSPSEGEEEKAVNNGGSEDVICNNVDRGTSTHVDENAPLTIKERVANLMNIIKENNYDERPVLKTVGGRKAWCRTNNTVKKLPKPVFQSADELTTYIRKCALETRAALENSEGAKQYGDFSNYQPTKEKCNTFRLPEAATELFLHAEEWYFFRGDESLSGGPCFTPTSQADYCVDIEDYYWNCNYCSPAWIDMGGADNGWAFQMCIDPESTEFGNLEAWHDGTGPSEGVMLIVNENDHKNGERFLIYLEEYAKRFIVNVEEYPGYFDTDLLTT